jgi:transposase
VDGIAGLDVSVRSTGIAVLPPEGRAVGERKVWTDPGALAAFLSECGAGYRRVGFEAGSLRPSLAAGLARAGVRVFCIRTLHVQAVLSAGINKINRNGARGIAQMMRLGLFRPNR